MCQVIRSLQPAGIMGGVGPLDRWEYWGLHLVSDGTGFPTQVSCFLQRHLVCRKRGFTFQSSFTTNIFDEMIKTMERQWYYLNLLHRWFSLNSFTLDSATVLIAWYWAYISQPGRLMQFQQQKKWTIKRQSRFIYSFSSCGIWNLLPSVHPERQE